MTTKLYLDARRAEEGKDAILKLSITHRRKVAYVAIGIKIPVEYWDPVKELVIRHKQANVLNSTIIKRKSEINDYIFERAKSGAYDNKDATFIRDDIKRKFFAMSEAKNGNFLPVYRKFVADRRTDSTKRIYNNMLNYLAKYCTDLESLNFTDISDEWVRGFVKSMVGLKQNSVWNYVSHFKAICKYAYDSGVIDFIPAHRISIKKEETLHRVLSLEQMRKIRDFKGKEKHMFYRDIFMLMFYLVGINISDLCALRPNDLSNGRINYKRLKTGKLYSIKVEPEAMEIIERYRGKKYLLKMYDNCPNFGSWQSSFANMIKTLMTRIDWGTVEVPKGVSSYYARHTWATMAHQCGISKDHISIALGHTMDGAHITNTYIRYEKNDIVDKANRKVIDYVMDKPKDKLDIEQLDEDTIKKVLALVLEKGIDGILKK